MPEAANTRDAAAPPRRPARLRKQAAILAEAERQFARFGFEGVALETIAGALGISRQNLLYYYASKEDLHRAVLDNVLEDWVGSMEQLSGGTEPREAIEQYVRAKLRFSQQRPSGTAVFTREVMAGAPRYAGSLAERVIPALRKDVRQLEKWARQGLIRRTNFTHLMFVLWSATQAYADLAPQFALYEGKAQLDRRDFAAAHKLIVDLVWNTLRV